MANLFIKTKLFFPLPTESIKSGPIYQCLNGHVTCKNCIPKLENCPICRNGCNPVRCLILEEILQKIENLPPNYLKGKSRNLKLDSGCHIHLIFFQRSLTFPSFQVSYEAMQCNASVKVQALQREGRVGAQYTIWTISSPITIFYSSHILTYFYSGLLLLPVFFYCLNPKKVGLS